MPSSSLSLASAQALAAALSRAPAVPLALLPALRACLARCALAGGGSGDGTPAPHAAGGGLLATHLRLLLAGDGGRPINLARGTPLQRELQAGCCSPSCSPEGRVGRSGPHTLPG